MTKEANGKHAILHPRYIPMDVARVSMLPLGIKYRTKKHFLNAKEHGKTIKGGAVIVANHTSFEDPLFITNLLWYRRLYFLAGEVLMDKRPQGILLRGLGCIRIDRNISDIDAIRTAVDKLKRGHLLVMFPQGGIKREEDVVNIKAGAILIAMQAKVPIIPVYTMKPEKWYMRRKAVIGEPFICSEHCKRKFPSVTDLNHLSEKLLCEMQRCEEVYQEKFL